MFRRATSKSYARVLSTGRDWGIVRTRAACLLTQGDVTPATMQLRARREQPAGPNGAKEPVKRARKETKSSSASEKVRGMEKADFSASARRSSRKKFKSEVVVQVNAESEEVNVAVGEDIKKKRIRVVKRGKDGRPEHWEEVLRGIQEMRAAQVADVDVAGVEVMFDEGKFEPHVSRFHVLISAMLSSQTKDPVNAAAMKRLIAHGLTVKDMLDIDEKELAQLIHPVGFYNNKARYIKQVAQILTDKAAETGSDVIDIPNTFDELVALPGVGPKMAHLVMSCAWDTTVGICVDTHVHRISNRLGWVKTWNKTNPKSQDPEKTRKELEEWLPREHWHPINVTLVGFGQTVCFPRGPKCSECKISHLCPSAFSSAI